MKKITSFLLPTIMIITVFAGCSVKTQTPVETIFDNNGFSVSYNVFDKNDTSFDMHTDIQETFINSDNKIIKKLGQGKESKDKADKIKVEYSTPFVLNISENEDMSNSFSIISDEKVAFIDNLKADTKYYITASVNNQTITLDPITTANCLPRVINVDGVKNVRDIGGWQTADGHKVRQGMIYRCGRLNESDTDKLNIEITDDGIDTFVNRLGVKSELDFRCNTNNETGTITKSPLGNGVAYYNFSMPWQGDFYLDNKQEVVNAFKIFADESNYPMIYHCNIGTDRTGMFTILILGLLEVSDEDIMKDYLFSNFADIGGSRSKKNVLNSSYYKEIMECEGETTSEKIHNFLLNLGVTENEIQSVISIMKE